jgi:O-antigen ligase
MSLIKLISYFSLVDDNFAFTLNYINNEGRFLFSLALLISFTLIRLDNINIKEISYQCRYLYLCWLPFFFIDAFIVEVFNITHHQKGAIIISGLFWHIIYESFCMERNNLLTSKLILSVSFLAIVMSNSRVSMIGFMIIFFYPLLSRYLFRASLVAISVLAVFIFHFEGRFELNGRQYDLSVVEAIPSAIEYGALYGDRFSNAHDFFSESNIKTADFNVAARFAMYAKSLVDFSTSPIIGIGVGRYDDTSSSCTTNTPLICLHDNGNSNYLGTTAHNLYLHTMVEEGLIGLLLILYILFKIFFSIRTLFIKMNQHRDFQKIAGFWIYFLFASFFNHTLVSPIYVIGILMPLIILSQLRVKKIHINKDVHI